MSRIPPGPRQDSAEAVYDYYHGKGAYWRDRPWEKRQPQHSERGRPKDYPQVDIEEFVRGMKLRNDNKRRCSAIHPTEMGIIAPEPLRSGA